MPPRWERGELLAIGGKTPLQDDVAGSGAIPLPSVLDYGVGRKIGATERNTK